MNRYAIYLKLVSSVERLSAFSFSYSGIMRERILARYQPKITKPTRIAVAGQSNAMLQDWSLTGLDCEFVQCAHGGSFLRDWGEDSVYYNWIKVRAKDCKLVIWWQGEAEARFGMPDDFFDSLCDLSSRIHRDIGAKLMPCTIERNADAPFLDQVNSAIRHVWREDPNSVTGPDLTSLECDDGPGFHLVSEQLRRQAALLWRRAIQNYDPSIH